MIGVGFGGDNRGSVTVNILGIPLLAWVILGLAIATGDSARPPERHQPAPPVPRVEVRLAGGEKWVGPTPMKNGESRTLDFATAESRKYLVLSLGLVSDRPNDPVCQRHAKADVALVSGAVPYTVVSHNQSVTIPLPGGTLGKFVVTLTVDAGCRMNITVITAILTDEPVGAH
ncbi:hypothetical protein [Kitasatospora sp. NPDC093806]|uniref:hypothetical protein n=1 Tax=Kitasatospora sp. NPDC093806 TaxID=3155075 RepID=UPI003447D696